MQQAKLEKHGKIGIHADTTEDCDIFIAAAIDKAKNRARKSLISVPLRGSTIPYLSHKKFIAIGLFGRLQTTIKNNKRGNASGNSVQQLEGI